MAHWQLDGDRRLDSEDSNGRRNGVSTWLDGDSMAMESMVMDSNGQRWTARQQLDSNGRIDGDGRC